jgi:predicted solute-binding protein
LHYRKTNQLTPQENSQELGSKFIKMYVDDLTVDMGDKGGAALKHCFALCAA